MLLLYTTFLRDNTKEWVGWTVLGVSIVGGIAIGFLMTKLQRVGAAIIAAWGGFLLGMILNQAILYLASSDIVFWCVCALCAIVAAILVFVAYNHAIILSTSLVGSYFFVRGFSLYIGGFPNEYTFLKQIENGTLSAEPWSFYVYLACIIAGTIVCAIVQYKQLANMTEAEKNPYERLR